MVKKVLEYISNLWYSVFRIDHEGGGVIMEGIFDARALACYISDKYKEFSKGNCISSIKLQKSLYFLLAFWGGFIRRGINSISELDVSNINDVLYSNEIQAWTYGPVVVDVFHAQKDGTLKDYRINLDSIFNEIPMLKDTIDSLLSDIFKIGDFKLVSTSHEDLAWKNHFDPDEFIHNEVITQEEIIQEYALKNEI